jgi:uncharacterized membrane protein
MAENNQFIYLAIAIVLILGFVFIYIYNNDDKSDKWIAKHVKIPPSAGGGSSN